MSTAFYLLALRRAAGLRYPTFFHYTATGRHRHSPPALFRTGRSPKDGLTFTLPVGKGTRIGAPVFPRVYETIEFSMPLFHIAPVYSRTYVNSSLLHPQRAAIVDILWIGIQSWQVGASQRVRE